MVYATADASVRDGTFADSNFGTANVLEVKGSTQTGYLRESFIKFDVENYIGQAVSSVSISVSLNSDSSPIDRLDIYTVPDDSWNENTLTFNNRPTQGTLVGSMTNRQTRATLNLNVAKTAMADGTLTLKFVRSTSSLNIYRIVSRENGNIALRPQLYITIGGTSARLESDTSIGLTLQLTVDFETVTNNLEQFAQELATLLSIPVETIPTSQIHVEAGHTGKAVVTLVITNFMNEDVDPFAAAERLQTLAETNDPSLNGTYFFGVEIMAQDTNALNGQESEGSADGDESMEASSASSMMIMMPFVCVTTLVALML
jgi:hypothetical protein